MNDLSFEEYWQQVDAELVRLFGQLGGDVVTNADQIAEAYMKGTPPARAALDIGAGRCLTPLP